MEIILGNRRSRTGSGIELDSYSCVYVLHGLSNGAELGIISGSFVSAVIRSRFHFRTSDLGGLWWTAGQDLN